MCGRFILNSPIAQLGMEFEFSERPNWRPNFNVAPTHDMPIVRLDDGERHLAMARWGLVPFWAKDLSIGARMINARSETVASKPAFRAAFKARRCLVPADGFYEWKRQAKTKQPNLVRRCDREPFAFAGLWERWDKTEEPVETFTIITTEPNDLMAEIHDRMPVILDRGDYQAWLDAAEPDLLKPCPSDWLEAYPVDRRVGNVKENDEGLIEPL